MSDDRDRLLLDQLQEQLERTRNLLAEGPEGAAEAVLARVGRRTADESRLVTLLADERPLAHPQQFPAAHRLAMRAIEVHDRDGWRDGGTRRLGPLAPIASYFIELIAKYIVRSFTSDVAHKIQLLYTRREAQTPDGDPQRRVLARARIQADRVSSGYRGGTASLPTLLVGGAAIPLFAGVGRPLGALNWVDTTVQVVLLTILFSLFAFLSYVLLQGAALARRRATLLIEQPLKALWETVGRCGHPPQDDATTFAAIAIVLTFVAWFLIPAAAALVYALR